MVRSIAIIERDYPMTDKRTFPPAGGRRYVRCRRSGFCLSLIALAASAVLPSGAEAQVCRDGIEPVKVHCDTLFAIGRPDGPVEEYLARDPRGGSVLMDVGPDGLIWILNPIDGHLMAFSDAGERLVSYSRKGSGPGEFQQAMALTAVTSGAWTWDWPNQQLCRWSLGGGLLETHRTDLPQPMFNRLVIDRTGTAWFLHDVVEEPEYEEIPVELRCLEPGGEQQAVAAFGIPGAMLPGRGFALSLFPSFAPLPAGGIVIATTHEYDLFGFTAVADEAILHWHFPSLETPYTARQRRTGGRGGFTPAGGELIEPPLLSHQPDLTDIHPACAEAFWITTQVRSDEGLRRIDYIDCEGNRTGSFWFPGRTGMIRGTIEQPVVLAYTPDGHQVFGLRIRIEDR